MRVLALISFIFVFMFPSPAEAQYPQPPIEAYGQLQEVSDVAISPNGERVAFILRNEGVNRLVVFSFNGEEPLIIGVGDLKVNDVDWAGDEHTILRAFEPTRLVGYRGKFNFDAAFSVNIKTKKYKQLLTNTKDLYPAQSGLGRIVGHLEGTDFVLMPAYTGTSSAVYSLMRVNLNTGKGRIFQRGKDDVIDWFVAPDGTILGQEIYDNKKHKYTLRTKVNGDWETVDEVVSEISPGGMIGVLPNKSGFAYIQSRKSGFHVVRQMSFDGESSEPLMGRDDAEISRVLVDDNRVVYGVEYGGLQPSYEFFDEDLTTLIRSVQDMAPNASVRIMSWSQNFERIILKLEGTGFAGDFLMLDRATGGITKIVSARSGIPTEAVGEVLTIEYPARDGLIIPAIMTLPPGAKMSNLPAIVMPHGGPEAHDQVGFDWMAQYFANRGYLVLQPNFRGSDGFGRDFTRAGDGGWGTTMQDDITDGVIALIDDGVIDPDRVCIVGWSYGGYAALAGGAFTPELYKCVAAIAAVTDLPRMLLDGKRRYGKDHWALSYWERAMADGEADREFLRARSPSEFAESFEAPVLLIHGRDDIVVNINQSNIMNRALRSADKDVTYIKMSGEDHSLLTPGARLEALQALDAFINEHIGSSE